MTTVTTPWGKATLVEEVEIHQDAGDRTFRTVVQLLEEGDGGQLVRFAYAAAGRPCRGPVTLRAQDLERLAAGLRERTALRRALRAGVGR